MADLRETIAQWREQRAWLLLMIEDVQTGEAFRGDWKAAAQADEVARLEAQCATLTTLLNYADDIVGELAERA